jgi:hypothetical protein
MMRIRSHESATNISDWLEAMLHTEGSSIPKLERAELMTGAGSIPKEHEYDISDPEEEFGTMQMPLLKPQSQQAGQVGGNEVLDPLDVPNPSENASTWTNISDDMELVERLLALYFCWEYPIFAFISREHFLKDFGDSRHRYCSPLLVNALLALACKYSNQSNTRIAPGDPNPSAFGDQFFKEAIALLDRENNHQTITTVQALGIMSIREASCGRISDGFRLSGQCMRVALEMGLHQSPHGIDRDELAVRCATFWGAFTLDL